MDQGGLYLHLCEDNVAPLEPGNTGIGFTADDFDEACKEMSGKGVVFSVPPKDEDGYKVAKFQDPDGNRVLAF